MIWFKSCPRCRGDLYQGEDIHGKYISCIQCGHMLTEIEEAIVREARIPDSLTGAIPE